METNRLPAERGLYNPAETDRIAQILSNSLFDPEYLLLFGTLAGGTPHSDAAAYDLLMAVRSAGDYTAAHVKRYLNSKFPPRRREIAPVNIYVMTLEEIETQKAPFLHFALTEGRLLYCKDRYRFRPPRKPHNFQAAYGEAKLYNDLFRPLGNRLLETAREAMAERTDDGIRMAAHTLAQAAMVCYEMLYHAYHNRTSGLRDPELMHERMRTLQSELMLLFDNGHVTHVTTLPRLRQFYEKAYNDPQFSVNPFVLEQDFERVERLGQIVERACRKRLELYKSLAGK